MSARLKLALVFGLAALVAVVVVGLSRQANDLPPVADTDQTPPHRGSNQSPPSLGPRATSPSEPKPPPPAVERLDEAWDELERADRIELATDEFERALNVLERDRSNPDARERANRALTLARPELLVEVGGAERHAALERRLEALTESE